MSVDNERRKMRDILTESITMINICRAGEQYAYSARNDKPRCGVQKGNPMLRAATL